MLRQSISVDGSLDTKALVVSHGSREKKATLPGVSQSSTGGGHDPADLAAIGLPTGKWYGHDIRRQHGADIVKNGIDAGPQAAVGVVLVYLVTGALLKGGDEVIDIQH